MCEFIIGLQVYYTLLAIYTPCCIESSRDNAYQVWASILGSIFILIMCFDEWGYNDYKDFIGTPRVFILLMKIICFDFPTRTYLLVQQPFEFSMQNIDHVLTLLPACLLLIIIHMLCIIEVTEYDYNSLRLMFLYNNILQIWHLFALFTNWPNILEFLYAIALGTILNMLFFCFRRDIESSNFNKIQAIVLVKLIFFDFILKVYLLAEQPFEWSVTESDRMLSAIPVCCCCCLFVQTLLRVETNLSILL